jgi:hypothetical protein
MVGGDESASHIRANDGLDPPPTTQNAPRIVMAKSYSTARRIVEQEFCQWTRRNDTLRRLSQLFKSLYLALRISHSGHLLNDLLRTSTWWRIRLVSLAGAVVDRGTWRASPVSFSERSPQSISPLSLSTLFLTKQSQMNRLALFRAVLTVPGRL